MFDLIFKISKIKISSIEDFNKLEEQHPDIFYFFSFIKNADARKFCDSVYENSKVIFEKYFDKHIKNELTLTLNEYRCLQSIFVFKSLKKSNFEIINEIDKNITIDNTISSHINLEKKYWIFEKKTLYLTCSEFKRIIFKLYSLLAYKKIINETILIDNFKTLKQWSIEYYEFEYSEIEKFKLSFSPFKVYELNDRYFLLSSFFLLTTEVFKENIFSSKRFHLKDKDYLKDLCNVPIFFDEKAFDRIYDRMEISLIGIEDKIKNHILKMKKSNEDINILINLNKEAYLIKASKKIETDMLEVKEMSSLLPFKIYLKQWIHSNFQLISYDNKSIEKIWIDLINDITEICEKLYDENDFIKILENNKIMIFNTLTNNISEDNNNINNNFDENLSKNFVQLNIKILINGYKKLNLFKTENVEYWDTMNEIRLMKKERILEQSTLFELYSLNNLVLIKKISHRLRGKKIYFPLFYDFRGRMYFNSSIGITNYKLSRFFFHYGWYKKEDIKKCDQILLPEIKQFEEKIFSIINMFKLNKTSHAIQSGIFWCVLAVAKEFIDKQKISTELTEIFEQGYQKIIEKNTEKDNEKWIILEHYKSIIMSYKENNIMKKFIHKDATASFIQNTIRILGPKNENSLEYANLKSRSKWYDTYALALDFWKNTLDIKNGAIHINGKIIDLSLLEYFIRITIKRPVMIDTYSASYLTQWDYFAIAVKKHFGKELKYGSDEEILFKNLIKFLSEVFWDEYFLANKSDTMIKHVNNLIENKKNIILFSNDSESDVVYYKIKTKTLDVTIKIPNSHIPIRKTKRINIIDEKNINIKKIRTAIKPNWVHFSDAYFSRQINKLIGKPLFTIHDCFLVDSLNVTKFINKSNEAFKILDNFSIAENRSLIKQVNSIFIFF